MFTMEIIWIIMVIIMVSLLIRDNIWVRRDSRIQIFDFVEFTVTHWPVACDTSIFKFVVIALFPSFKTTCASSEKIFLENKDFVKGAVSKTKINVNVFYLPVAIAPWVTFCPNFIRSHFCSVCDTNSLIFTVVTAVFVIRRALTSFINAYCAIVPLFWDLKSFFWIWFIKTFNLILFFSKLHSQLPPVHFFVKSNHGLFLLCVPT